MPKKKIQVMVEPPVFETIQNFASITNQSISAVVADYLAMAEPTFKKMALSMEGFKLMSEAQRKTFVENLQASEEIARGHAEEAVLLVNGLFSEGEPVGLPDSGFSFSENPNRKVSAPATNRGDSSPSENQPKPKPSKAPKRVQPTSKKLKMGV